MSIKGMASSEVDSVSQLCEYCGDLFHFSYTKIKICHGRLRHVCWLCIHDIAYSDQGVDLSTND